MTALRIATTKDLNALIAMGEALQAESRAYEPFLTFDAQQAHSHYTKEIDNQKAYIIVALGMDDVPIGYHYSYITTLDYLSERTQECVFEAVYVQPEYRGQGIAKMLTRHAEQWAFETMKVDRIKSGVYTGNASSEQLHVREGFVPYHTEYIKLCD